MVPPGNEGKKTRKSARGLFSTLHPRTVMKEQETLLAVLRGGGRGIRGTPIGISVYISSVELDNDCRYARLDNASKTEKGSVWEEELQKYCNCFVLKRAEGKTGMGQS